MPTNVLNEVQFDQQRSQIRRETILTASTPASAGDCVFSPPSSVCVVKVVEDETSLRKEVRKDCRSAFCANCSINPVQHQIERLYHRTGWETYLQRRCYSTTRSQQSPGCRRGSGGMLRMDWSIESKTSPENRVLGVTVSAHESAAVEVELELLPLLPPLLPPFLLPFFFDCGKDSTGRIDSG